MRSASYAVVILAGLSSGASAQNNSSQFPVDAGGQHGIARREAPVGHRQPRLKDLPPDVVQGEQAQKPAEEKTLDKKLNICKGC